MLPGLELPEITCSDVLVMPPGLEITAVSHMIWSSLYPLQLLGLRGVLDLLGLRCTSGSCELLPPPRCALLASFTKQHSPPAHLSVGGRALSKHCHRDASRQWWGESTGCKSIKGLRMGEVPTPRRHIYIHVWLFIL